MAYIKLQSCEFTNEIIKNHPKAFLLLTQIAIRADNKTLTAKIGDFENIGLTRQEYRTAQIMCEKLQLASFCRKKSGTLATILNDKVYVVSKDFIPNHQNNHQNNHHVEDDISAVQIEEQAFTKVTPTIKTTIKTTTNYINKKYTPKPPEGEEEKKEVIDFSLELEKIIQVWNSYRENLDPRWKRVNVVTKDIEEAYKKIRAPIPKEEFVRRWNSSVRNYMDEIKTRDPKNSYYLHRFTFFEFLKQKNGYQKFLNS